MPLFKPYRMFPEFDHLSDTECERYVRDAHINWTSLTGRAPLIVTTLITALWFVGWPVVVATFPVVRNVVPIPSSTDLALVVYAAGGVLTTGLAYLISRDVGIYLGIRRELHRASCRKCRQSLMGLPIQSVGTEPDPSKQFVRCTECGRRWVLLDIGLTPRDLVPYEQRVISADVARVRRRSE